MRILIFLLISVLLFSCKESTEEEQVLVDNKEDVRKNENYFREKQPSTSNPDSNCESQKPTTIEDLTEGLSLTTHLFNKDNQSAISLFGFGNINIGKNQQVIIVEYFQTGNHFCQENTTRYGIGARMMIKATQKKRSAKLNTPQQISASITFEYAEAEFNIKTVGITGPGTTKLIQAGKLSEDTYSKFLNSISNLILDAYEAKGDYRITPQKMLTNTAG